MVDDDYTPPEPVHVDPLETCPTCGKPLKKHSNSALLRCVAAVPPEEGTYEAWRAQQDAAPPPPDQLPPAPVEQPTVQAQPDVDKTAQELAAAKAAAVAAVEARKVLEAQVATLQKRNRTLREQTKARHPAKVVDTADILDVVERTPGWSARKLSGGHIGIQKDGRTLATIPATPSDYRSVKNTRAMLRKVGLPV